MAVFVPNVRRQSKIQRKLRALRSAVLEVSIGIGDVLVLATITHTHISWIEYIGSAVLLVWTFLGICTHALE